MLPCFSSTRSAAVSSACTRLAAPSMFSSAPTCTDHNASAAQSAHTAATPHRSLGTDRHVLHVCTRGLQQLSPVRLQQQLAVRRA